MRGSVSPTAWIVAAVAMVAVGAAATTGPAPSERHCSGGTKAGVSCATDADCPDGVCHRLHAICDAGGDERFDCPCPGGTCVLGLGCGGDTDLGTCSGGSRAGSCCDPFVACGDGAACVTTAKICAGGLEKGFGCLRDAHCPGSDCVATTSVCRGGMFDGFPCLEPPDCAAGAVCEGWIAPTPGPGPACVGDCDGSGSVTVDEILTLVNIGLGAATTTACTAGDADGDGSITVDEIITAVRNGLEGCAAASVS